MPLGTEKKVTRRVGGVRPSQLMYAFGIGSVVDLRTSPCSSEGSTIGTKPSRP